jgi:hypothetical protein
MIPNSEQPAIIAFTLKEVAQALHCSPLFLVKEARRGKLIIRQINAQSRIILAEDLAAYLESKILTGDSS